MNAARAVLGHDVSHLRNITFRGCGLLGFAVAIACFINAVGLLDEASAGSATAPALSQPSAAAAPAHPKRAALQQRAGTSPAIPGSVWMALAHARLEFHALNPDGSDDIKVEGIADRISQEAQRAPSRASAAEAQALLAQCYVYLRDQQRANAALLTELSLSGAQGEREYAAWRLLHLVEQKLRQGDRFTALTLMDEFLQRYPGTRAEEERGIILAAQVHGEMNDHPAAMDAFKLYLAKFPNGAKREFVYRCLAAAQGNSGHRDLAAATMARWEEERASAPPVEPVRTPTTPTPPAAPCSACGK